MMVTQSVLDAFQEQEEAKLKQKYEGNKNPEETITKNDSHKNRDVSHFQNVDHSLSQLLKGKSS